MWFGVMVTAPESTVTCIIAMLSRGQCLLRVISAPPFVREGEYRKGQAKHCEAVVHNPTREAHANFVREEKHEYQNTSYKGYLTEKLVNRLHQKPLDPTAVSCNNIIETSIEPANVGIIQI